MEAVSHVRLTAYTQKAGCASKFAPGYLERALEGFAPAERDGYASGIESREDAGYVDFGGGLLLQSVDFFTPIVDDPHRFGEIAAANALSDIYAMGGEPLTALNLVAFPCELDSGVLHEILAGGASKLDEAGVRLLGGHSVQDDVPKYGVAVTGFVERERVVRNRGAQPGDALVLTKPLGLGILATALKRGRVGESEIERAVAAAARLNRGARDAMQAVSPSAATDVTGFGLIGHLGEMTLDAGLGAVLHLSAVPVWERVGELAAEAAMRPASSPTASTAKPTWSATASAGTSCCPCTTRRRAAACWSRSATTASSRSCPSSAGAASRPP
jgi:selenide,water dikinase